MIAHLPPLCPAAIALSLGLALFLLALAIARAAADLHDIDEGQAFGGDE